MKNHSNRILTVFFAVSLVVSISLFLVRAVAFPFEIYGAVEICAFYFPAVPFLFLQMLLCKAVQKKWVKFLPLLVVAIVAIVAAVGCVAASGWDTLGYLILLLLCIGPALGCIIGIVADWLWRKRDYAVSARSYVFMAALPLLVVAAAIFTDWHGNLGARQSQGQIGVISAPICAFYHRSLGGFSIVSVQPCPLFSRSGSKVGQRQ